MWLNEPQHCPVHGRSPAKQEQLEPRSVLRKKMEVARKLVEEEGCKCMEHGQKELSQERRRREEGVTAELQTEESPACSDKRAVKLRKKRKRSSYVPPSERTTIEAPEPEEDPAVKSLASFTYEQYLKYKDNASICNFRINTTDHDIVNVPVTDMILNSVFYSEKIKHIDTPQPLEASVPVDTETVTLLFKIFYERKINEADLKDKFFDLLLLTYFLDFDCIMDALVPHTRRMTETQIFRDKFTDYVIRRDKSFFEGVAKYIFAEFTVEILYPFVIGLFTCDQANDMSLEQRREILSYTKLGKYL